MDASEHDLDAKLYKASAVLLQEIQHKLPLLLFKPGQASPTRRLYVLDQKSEELSLLLDRFQEWPQLLDPHLSSFVHSLADAFLHHLTTASQVYSPSAKHGTASISPLPRAICRLLYSLCKVRGQKVIVRLLNNEPRYLAPMLSGFHAWNAPSRGMSWEERYIMILWLSHLMLAPFELATISAGDNYPLDTSLIQAFGELPGIAGNVLSLGFQHLDSSGKEREAASVLLVRLSLRKDMQSHDLAARLVNHALQTLLTGDDLVTRRAYKPLGLLGLIYGIVNSSSDSEVAPYLEMLFKSVAKIATDQGSQYAHLRDAAPARKWILKIFRVMLTHALSLQAKRATITHDHVTMMLEEGIQYFLDALCDKDTPVRMAAAKTLSVVTLKLDLAMSTEVVEAILGCLQENTLWEVPQDQKLIPVTDRARTDTAGMKRNISAVDPLRWHGLMLTLGHLLFRRSPPPVMLPEIIEALIVGLEFEQRSNVGTSVGVGVRDAACFGLWALARKYSTLELEAVRMSSFAEATLAEYANCNSVLQLIAIKLTASGCFDPSGNLRRGSSAALQELIGRHPDTILHGIPIVQIVDYHSIARLSRAMIEVGPQAAALDQTYHRPLLQALIEWRGGRATDVNQRRWAATAVRVFTTSLAPSETCALIRRILRQLLALKQANVGSTAAARHGLLLALTSALESITESDLDTAVALFSGEGKHLFALNELTGKISSRVTADLELVMEGTAALIGKLCQCCQQSPLHLASLQHDWISSASAVLDQCTLAGGKDIVVQCSATANVELFKLLPEPANIAMVESWLDSARQSASNFTSPGRIRSLSLIFVHLAQAEWHPALRQAILSHVTKLIESNEKIETRINAMEALGVILQNLEIHSHADAVSVSNFLRRGLTDYTNDQRGDIGSTLRLQSIEAVDAFRLNTKCYQFSDDVMEVVMPLVVKLAAEKLTNVRFRAWKCLESYWQTRPQMPELKSTFHYPIDVSSVEYFQQLLELLSEEWSQEHILLGLVSSATSGSEEICRTAGTALVSYLQTLDLDQRQHLIEVITSVTLKQLDLNATQDDRQVVPLLDFTCLLMDQDLFSTSMISRTEHSGKAWDIWSTMQKVQGTSSSLPRIEASLNIYSRLLAIDQHRTRAMDKLTRQLLHRWPKVRNMAADLLYLDTPTQTLAVCDWNRPVNTTKPVVLELRKHLGVAGYTVSQS